MRSSIFNSKNPRIHWLIVWGIVICICGFSLLKYESFLKKRDFLPSVESTKDLWSWYRNKAYGDKTIVLLGASRSLLGLNIPTIKKALPDYTVVQLSLNGKYPMGTLMSLANDPDFHGNIIISIKSESLNIAFFQMQKQWYDYYENSSTFYKSFNAYIFAFLQSKLRFLHPSLELKEIIGQLYKSDSFIKADYVSGQLDLSIAADYSKINGEAIGAGYAKSSKGYWMNNSVPKIEDWMEGIKSAQQAVKKIKAKNGQVIFLRMPTDDALWQIDEEFFPRKNYWDAIMRQLKTDSIHFKDVPGLDKFNLPDDSHLDQKDSAAFTKILINHIKSNQLLN